MKSMLRKVLELFLMCIWLVACDDVPEITPSGKTFSIAFVGNDGTGHSGRDKDILEGILSANAAAPVLDNGDRLKIVHTIDTGTGNRSHDTISNTISRYVEQEHISAVLLGAPSKTLLLEKQTINALGLPALALVATHPDITDDADFISQLSFDDKRQAQAAALFVRDELGLKRVAVLFDDEDIYSGYLGQMFRTTFEKTGGYIDHFSVVSQLNQSLLESLKGMGTQLIYMPLGAQQVFHVKDQLSIVNWSPLTMATDGLMAAVLQDHPDRLSELDGMYVTDLYSHSFEFVSLARFVKRISGFYDQMFNNESSTDTALGIEGYQILKFAINLCPDRNNSICINQEIRSIKNHQGIMSKFSILADGKSSRPVFINTIKEGRLQLVVKVN